MSRGLAAARAAMAGRIGINSQNLILRSEDFSNSQWTKVRSSVTSGAVGAPFGGGLADKIVEDTATGIHNVQTASTITAPKGSTQLGAIIFSVWAKAAGRQYCILSETSNTGTNETFDLINGTKRNTAGAASGMQDYGNGWWLLWLTPEYFTPDVLWIHLANASVVQGSSGYTGDGSSGIYLWGASAQYVPIQDNVNLSGFNAQYLPVFSRGPYVKTTSAIVNDTTPRVLQSGGNNYCRNSEAIETLNLMTSSSGVADPFGGTGAFTVNEGTGSGTHRTVYATASISGYLYKASCWVKYIDRQYVSLTFNGNGCTFDLIAGTVVGSSAGASATIRKSGQNGYYRLCVLAAPPAGNDSNINLLPNDTIGNATYVGTSKSFSYFGMQLTGYPPGSILTAEPEAYIKTTGSAIGTGGAASRYPISVPRAI